MADIFELGFRIDTTPLNAAKTAAENAARSVSQLGDAEEKAARQAKTLADAQKQASGAKGDAAASADRLANSLGGLSGKISVSAQSLQQMAAIMGSGGMGGGGLAAGMGVASQALGRFAAALGPVGVAVGATVVALGALAIAAKSTLEPLARASDNFELFKARLNNALEDSGLAADALDRLTKMAAETGLGFQTTADSFLRFARANQTIGANNDQLLQFTETVQKLGAVSGASLGETQSAMMQLGQALSSGRLQGDELRSIGENAPGILKAIADGIGVSVGQLRAMGSAGELSTNKIFEAILKSTNRVRQEFANLPDTVERQNQRLTDAWDRMLATMGEKLKASDIYKFFQTQLLNAINAANEAMRTPTATETAQSNLRNIQQRIVMTGGPLMDPQRMAAVRGFATLDDRNATDEAKQQAQLDINRYLEVRLKVLREVAAGSGGGGAANILRQLEEAAGGVVNAQLAAEERGRASAEVEARRSRMAVIETGTTAGREYDDFQSRITKLDKARREVQAAIAQARASSSATDQNERDLANASLGPLQRQLDAIERDARRAQPALAKLRDEINDAQEAARRAGGYGGGFTLMAEAIKAAQSAEAQGGSIEQFATALAGKRAEELKEQAAQIQRQVTQQRELTEQQALGADMVRLLTNRQEDANRQFEIMGNLSREKFPELYAAMERLIGLQRQLRDASRDTSEAQAEALTRVTVRGLEAQRRAAQDGPGAVTRAQQSAEIERIMQSQGYAAALRREREQTAQNEANAASNITEAELRAFRARQMVGMTPRARADYEARVARSDAERRGVTPEESKRLGDAAEGEARARMADQDAQTIRNGQLELEQAQRRMQFVNMTTENLRVQEAVLRRETELRREGVDVESEYGRRLLAQTKEIELQTIAFEKQRQMVEGVFGVLDNAASGFRGVMISTFEEVFRTGKFNSENFFNGLSGLIAKAGAEMMYEISIKPFVMAAANAAKMWASSLFSSGAAGAANGAAFTLGGVKEFASGGIVGSPTYFAFANGGRLGLMGEAGPEAIMPLKRGADGKLGVGGYGGGGDVTVVINDQRGKGEQVGVEQGTGPDGQRIISIMVRDEVKRAIRSGEMDRDMATNFGTTRPVQRR